jgi:adenine deaminase
MTAPTRAGVTEELAARRHLLAVARGDAEPDLVVGGGRVFSAFTREWLEGDVGIAGGRIAGIGSFDGGTRIDAGGRPVVPGFIDAHVHLESSKLTPAEFARVVVPRGTTGVVADPHEIANVLGLEGVRWLLDSARGIPLDVHAMAPSCVPASPLESPRGAFSPEDVAGLARGAGMGGVAEMMNYPAVIAGDPEELTKLLLAGRPADGHAPGVLGRDLDAYVAAGIATDHEATTYEEALAKRRRGMWVLLREASNARNLLDLLPLVRRHGPDRCAFCTDDREPTTLVRDGHMDAMCRMAVAAGIAPEDVLLLASTHPALCHGLAGRGAIVPGHHADLVVLEDLQEFRATVVVKDGAVVARNGTAEPFPAPPTPAWVTSTMHLAPVAEADLALPAAGAVRVIELVPGQLLTGERVAEARVQDGRTVADPARDLAKIAVVERHHATGRVGAGLVHGFGLGRGAFASTVAHDAHNVIVVGTDDADMVRCTEHLAALGGGMCVVAGGEILADLALPVAGLLSDRPGPEVAAAVDRLDAALRSLGVRIDEPLMALSFLGLSVIPALKVTDRGLVDVVAGSVVGLGA